MGMSSCSGESNDIKLSSMRSSPLCRISPAAPAFVFATAGGTDVGFGGLAASADTFSNARLAALAALSSFLVGFLTRPFFPIFWGIDDSGRGSELLGPAILVRLDVYVVVESRARDFRVSRVLHRFNH
ncbi:hypothetical protein C8R45DRAFT_1017742 [Mycena sanguinolenta]|nr:hypothetical protein C8R45DRAFT_1017742 [Mycena sanguinolenta]